MEPMQREMIRIYKLKLEHQRSMRAPTIGLHRDPETTGCCCTMGKQ